MSLYRFCGESQIGKSHEVNGTECQDAYSYYVGPEIIVSAVADGLGSSKHSDIASKMAARGAVEFCAANFFKGITDEQIVEMIKSSFEKVNLLIKQKAGDSLDDYDTTLTLAVYMNGKVFFGHAGDSGIIALRSDGIFEEVTKPQLGSGHGKERPVYPLAAESHWVFGKYGHIAKAIFLMTDGILNKVVPPLLEDQEYKLDHAYLYYLYDNLCKNPYLNSWLSEELSSILPQEINYDDKTLVAVVGKTVYLKRQAKSYYEYPKKELWDSLLEKHNRKMYGYKDGNAQPPKPADTFKTTSSLPQSSSGQTRDDSRIQRYYRQQQKRVNMLRRYLIVLAVGLVLGLLLGIIATLAIVNPSDKDQNEPDPSTATPHDLQSSTSTSTPTNVRPQTTTTPSTILQD